MAHADKDEQDPLFKDTDGDDDSTTSTLWHNEPPRPHRNWWIYMTLVVCLLSTSTSIAALVVTLKLSGGSTETLISSKPPTASPAVQGSELRAASCGSSIEEAEELGCSLDMVLGGWVPPLCHNATLAADALNYTINEILNTQGEAGPLLWYEEPRFERPISDSTLVPYLKTLNQSDMTVYTTPKYHVGHCLYRWQIAESAMARSIAGEDDIMVMNGATGIGHSDHCRKEILMRVREPRKETRTVQKFMLFHCVPFDGR